MRKRTFSFVLALLVLVLVSGFLFEGPALARDQVPARGKVVIANRASGSISVIDAQSDELVGTFDLPMNPGDNVPEPMYVVFTPVKGHVFVGDRANDRVVVFDARDFSVEATVETGSGIFHMWADGRGKQLWVNNDIDNTTTVIDPGTLEVIATVPTPADLVAAGGKPHDVILDTFGRFAYVTVLGLPGPNDYVIQYSTRTFEEINRAPVGKDPHVSLMRTNTQLFVPSQNSDVVVVLDRRTLEHVADIPVPGAHGAGMTRDGSVFYTTNLPGGGTDGLFAIDAESNLVIDAVNTPFAVPHNIALTPSGHKLFVTHSGGTSDKVTIYTTSGSDPVPVFSGQVTVGFNPFGLAYVP
jgi:YVTN family beta-propeller protein